MAIPRRLGIQLVTALKRISPIVESQRVRREHPHRDISDSGISSGIHQLWSRVKDLGLFAAEFLKQDGLGQCAALSLIVGLSLMAEIRSAESVEESRSGDEPTVQGLVESQTNRQ